MSAGASKAKALDLADPLRGKRELFQLPAGVIYLDGNSLGPPPKAAFAELEQAARQEWGEGLIRSWNAAGWWSLTDTLGDRIGRLIGADAGETVVTDTTSINIFKALHAALALRPERHVILAERDSFPTDLYIAEGVVASRPGSELRLAADSADLAAMIDERTAVVLINHVDYRTGALRDMAHLTSRAHQSGRPCPLGPLPQRRRGADRARRARRRFRHRLHLQVPERRPRRAGLHLRQPASPRGPRPAAVRLVGARGSLRHGERLSAGRRHPPPAVRHPAHPVAARAEGRARCAGRHRCRGHPRQEPCPDGLLHGARRADLPRFRRPHHHAARRWPRQPGGDRPRAGLSRGPGADRARHHRRLPRARHHALRLRAALSQLPRRRRRGRGIA